MSEIYNAILGGDVGAFQMLLQMLLSMDNEQRSQGEKMLNDLQSNPDLCSTLLIRGLRSSEKVEERSLCAVLLRRVSDAPIQRKVIGGYV